MRCINFLIKFYPLLLLVILPLLFFYPIFQGQVLFPGKVFQGEFYPWRDLPVKETYLPGESDKFYGSDPFTTVLPWRIIGTEMIKRGEFPLWNPYSFAGSPFLANYQTAFFYPLNILYFLLDVTIAWSALTIIQIILAGVFCYLLLRQYQFSKFACTWGAFIYSWNGYLANYFHTQVIGHVLIWLPLVLFILNKINYKFKVKLFLILVFSLVSLLLGGYLQTTVYSLGIILFYCLFLCRKSLSIFVLALVISLGLSAAQLVPTVEFLSKSGRDAASFYDSFSFIMPPLQMLRFILPGFFGHPNLENWWGGMLPRDHPFVGILGIAFALVGMVLVLKRKEYRFWLFLSFALLILTVESHFTRFIYSLSIPLLNSVTPSRGFGIIVFPISFLSAYGIEGLITMKRQTWRLIIMIFMVLVSIALLSFFYTTFTFPRNFNINETIRKSLIIFLVINLLSLGVIIAYVKRLLPLYMVISLLFLIQVSNLLYENNFFTRYFISKNLVYPKTELTNFLSTDQNRFLSLNLWLFIPNSFMPYHLRTVTAYDAIHLREPVFFAQHIFQNIPQSYNFDHRSIKYSGFDIRLMDLLNIRYVLDLQPLKQTNLSFVKKIGSVYVYENKDFKPPAFFVPNVKVLEKKEIVQQIFNSKTDLLKTVFLEEKPPLEISGDSQGFVKQIKRNSQSSGWDVYTPVPQILFFSESYDSGWEALIDGKKTKVFKANLAFQGVVVPPGEHKVELRYSPFSFWLGLVISFISILTVVSIAIILATKRFIFLRIFRF